MPDLSFPTAVAGVGTITIAKLVWDAILSGLDELRKKREETRTGQREPLVRKSLALDVASDAEAYAERRISNLQTQVEQLTAKNDRQAAELEAAAAETRRMRGEIAQLYGDLYRQDQRNRGPGTT